MDKIYCCECDEEIKEEDVSNYCSGCGSPVCFKCDNSEYVYICECCEVETHD